MENPKLSLEAIQGSEGGLPLGLEEWRDSHQLEP